MKRLSLSLSADLCIHSYWLSQLGQASHRKMIQSSALRLRLCHFKISSDTPALNRCTELEMIQDREGGIEILETVWGECLQKPR